MSTCTEIDEDNIAGQFYLIKTRSGDTVNCSSKETQCVSCGATNRETEEQSEDAPSSVLRPKRSDHVQLSSKIKANKPQKRNIEGLYEICGPRGILGDIN